MTPDDSALVPALDPLMPEDVLETVESQQQPLEERDAALAALSGDPGFQIIQKKMQAYVDGFRSGKSVGITSTMTITEVGEKFLVASGIATVLEDILSDITNAQKAIQSREEQRAAQAAGTGQA